MLCGMKRLGLADCFWFKLQEMRFCGTLKQLLPLSKVSRSKIPKHIVNCFDLWLVMGSLVLLQLHFSGGWGEREGGRERKEEREREGEMERQTVG